MKCPFETSLIFLSLFSPTSSFLLSIERTAATAAAIKSDNVRDMKNEILRGGRTNAKTNTKLLMEAFAQKKSDSEK